MGAFQVSACGKCSGAWETAIPSIRHAIEACRCAQRWTGKAGSANKLAAYSAVWSAGGGTARSTGLILVAGS